MKDKLKKMQEKALKNHTYQFWKDGNPDKCFNCGKTKEELFKETYKLRK